jgi:chemotaxis regulatin CheY-phosphate phosphatase CheZ
MDDDEFEQWVLIMQKLLLMLKEKVDADQTVINEFEKDMNDIIDRWATLKRNRITEAKAKKLYLDVNHVYPWQKGRK